MREYLRTDRTADGADLPTREQQIAVAERVPAVPGRGAWPTSGRGQ